VPAPPPPPPPAKAKRRGGSRLAWIVLGIIVGFGVVLVGFFIIVGMGMAAAGSADFDLALDEESTRFREVHVAGERSVKERILVVPIKGVILGSGGSDVAGQPDMVERVRQLLRKARKDKRIKALLLDIDSPGGGVTASDIIYHELKTFRSETDKPIVALFGDVAASGGYYVAMAADHVVARQTTITGSIGVISRFVIWMELMRKIGVEVETIKSPKAGGGESLKDIGSGFRKMTEAERALLQGLVTEMWQRFVTVVGEGRKGRLELDQVRALADGRVFTGKQALALKLVDSVGYRDAAIDKVRELAKSPKARVVSLKRIPSLGDIFAELRGGVGGSDNLLQTAHRLGREAPKLMYLWTGR